ncbi:MAG: hypothetical protein NWF01_00445 [Candidatus Bathyarchaeota archaeon]|nr:hypothetical protein [Candidatus Bathyarchaeota archaeon]
MSTSFDATSDWNFRVFDQRVVTVKSKNEKIRKAAVMDSLLGLMFSVEVPEEISMQDLTIDKEVLVNLKVYTSKSTAGVDEAFLGFFEALDVNQNMGDFIGAYWVYPTKIRFKLVELEET